MKYLIVTNCHGENGKVLELMESKHHSLLQDDRQRLFQPSDVVKVDDEFDELISQGYNAAEQLKYWRKVLLTIANYMVAESEVK